MDANEIPYVVLSPSFRNTYHVKPGDLAIVYRRKKSSIAYGIFADGGDLGEASVKLHRDLDNEPVSNSKGVSRANRGMDDRVITVVFPGVNIPGSVNTDAWYGQIQKTGKDSLERWGNAGRAKACAEESAVQGAR